jgi:hypothetical protein
MNRVGSSSDTEAFNEFKAIYVARFDSDVTRLFTFPLQSLVPTAFSYFNPNRYVGWKRTLKRLKLLVKYFFQLDHNLMYLLKHKYKL